MNIRNEMDEALDRALELHLQDLFKSFFSDEDVSKLKTALEKAEVSYNKANKALE